MRLFFWHIYGKRSRKNVSMLVRDLCYSMTHEPWDWQDGSIDNLHQVARGNLRVTYSDTGTWGFKTTNAYKERWEFPKGISLIEHKGLNMLPAVIPITTVEKIKLHEALDKCRQLILADNIVEDVSARALHLYNIIEELLKAHKSEALRYVQDEYVSNIAKEILEK